MNQNRTVTGLFGSVDYERCFWCAPKRLWCRNFFFVFFFSVAQQPNIQLCGKAGLRISLPRVGFHRTLLPVFTDRDRQRETGVRAGSLLLLLLLGLVTVSDLAPNSVLTNVNHLHLRSGWEGGGVWGADGEALSEGDFMWSWEREREQRDITCAHLSVGRNVEKGKSSARRRHTFTRPPSSLLSPPSLCLPLALWSPTCRQTRDQLERWRRSCRIREMTPARTVELQVGPR